MYTYPRHAGFFIRSMLLAAVCVAPAHRGRCAETALSSQSEAAFKPAKPLTVGSELQAVINRGQPETPADLRALQHQVRRVVDAAREATVSIELDDSVGSGVIVSPDGVVLTAGHVSMEPNQKVWVRFKDGRRVRALSLGVDHTIDCGMLRITTPPKSAGAGEGDGADDAAPPPWPHRPLSEEPVSPGQWVVGLGHPNGFVIGRAPPVRIGRVLSMRQGMINTDVALVGGDSGGPLLNLRGEVVGVHSRIGERITSNFHVPVTAFRREWQRLANGRMTGVPDGEDPADSRPLIGLAVRETPEGLVVTQVFDGSPADEAGVVPGDLLLGLAGREASKPHQLERLARSLEPYDRAPIAVRRGGEQLELSLWVGRASVEFPGMGRGFSRPLMGGAP